MPRKKLIRTREHVYHITTRSNSKEWFYLPNVEVWRICLETLKRGYKEFKVEIHAFVLMSNHYHMMVRTPECDIDKFMHFFNKTMSNRINQSTGRINHVFGGTYKWSIVETERYYRNALKYLYQNPLRAELSECAESYPYSTLKKNRLGFPIHCYIKNLDMDWINQLYSEDDQERIRKGFKRKIFKPKYEQSSRRNTLIM